MYYPEVADIRLYFSIPSDVNIIGIPMGKYLGEQVSL